MSYIKIGNFNLHRLDSISGTFYIQNQCDICGWHGELHYQSDPKQHQNCADERAAHKCQNACYDDEKHDAKINQTYSVYDQSSMTLKQYIELRGINNNKLM